MEIPSPWLWPSVFSLVSFLSRKLFTDTLPWVHLYISHFAAGSGLEICLRNKKRSWWHRRPSSLPLLPSPPAPWQQLQFMPTVRPLAPSVWLSLPSSFIWRCTSCHANVITGGPSFGYGSWQVHHGTGHPSDGDYSRHNGIHGGPQDFSVLSSPRPPDWGDHFYYDCTVNISCVPPTMTSLWWSMPAPT